MIHLNRSLFFELHERAVALTDTLRVAGQFLVAVVRGLTSIKKTSTLWLGSRFLNWGFQLSFLWYQLLSSSYYQDQFALGFCCSQITSNFVSGSNPDNTALWSIAANTGKFRCGNRNPQSLCHCATPSSCLWCTQLLPNPPRGNRLPVWQLPSCILTGYSILSGPPSKGSAKTLVLMQWQAAEAKLQSPFHLSGVVPAAPGGQRSSQRSEQGAIPPCCPSSCFFRQSWTVSSVTCPRPPRTSTELGIGSMSPHSQAQGGQFWLFIFFKNKAFLPVGCWAPWHQPLQTAPASQEWSGHNFQVIQRLSAGTQGERLPIQTMQGKCYAKSLLHPLPSHPFSLHLVFRRCFSWLWPGFCCTLCVELCSPPREKGYFIERFSIS